MVRRVCFVGYFTLSFSNVISFEGKKENNLAFSRKAGIEAQILHRGA